MNQYRDLVAKLEAIQNREKTVEESHMDPVQEKDVPVEECGMPGMDNMPHGMMGAPKQQDNVTMNVSMNGSGAGGIRDLMGILKNIEQGGAEQDSDAVLVGMKADEAQSEFGDVDTTPNPETHGVDAVTATGDDLHSKGDMGHRGVSVSGSNGLAETLLGQLSQLYQEVKLR